MNSKMKGKSAKPIDLYETITITKPMVISFNRVAVNLSKKFEDTFIEFVNRYDELNTRYSHILNRTLNEILDDMSKNNINPILLMHILVRQMLGVIEVLSLYMAHQVCGNKCSSKDIEEAVSLMFEMTTLELVSFYEEVKENTKKRYGSSNEIVSSYI